MSWGGGGWPRGISSLCNLSRMITSGGFRTGDLLSAFVKSGGPEIDRFARLFRDFDLKEELLSGRVKCLTKIDPPNGIIRRSLSIRHISIIPLAEIGR